MTTSQFIEKVAAYFQAKYNEDQKEAITRWATHHVSALDRLYRSLTDDKTDWRGPLPLVSHMRERAESLGLVKGPKYPVPDDKPQVCKACGNEYLDDQHAVQLCRMCKSAWLWMESGKWEFVRSQQAMLKDYKKL